MEKKKNSFNEAMKKLIGSHYSKLLYIDITADTYEILYKSDCGCELCSKAESEGNISEWFSCFAESPLCHEKDRERFKRFSNLENLKRTFEQSGYEPSELIYRRKFIESEQVYSTVSMELVPELREDGHTVAFLFVKNITESIRKYNEIMEKNAAADISSTEKRSVLIVEDNEMNREILTVILEDTYNVLQAENGAVGLELLQKNMNEISVVILDVQMPVMNGYEFLEKTESDPFLSKIPIVVATAGGSIEEEQKCLTLGASDFIVKPYNAEIIMRRIAGIIRLRESAATMAMLQTDELTGLYSRQAFNYYANLTLERSSANTYAIAVIEIERYMLLKETYAESLIREMLKRIAELLQESTAEGDICGCYGDAKYLVLLGNKDSEQLKRWLEETFSAFEKACGIKGISFRAGIYADIDKSLQISVSSDRALAALSGAGNNFGNKYSFYDEKYAEKFQRLAELEADMREAYDKEQFSVYYQPKHDAETGKLVGAEALIRWIHPKYGFLSPAEFIPLFERNGFVTYADYYVLKRTCSNLRRWKAEGLNPVPVSVNASRRDLDDDNYPEKLLKPIRENNIDTSLIHLEVTETLFTDRVEELSAVLQKCREAGIVVELDDFGAGYSSLTTLASLPMDVMKLDMSFMKSFGDEKRHKILSACIGLAKSLGMKTVQEGVETEQQLKLLREMGCDWIQGYYFSKPLPEEEFREYLIKHSDK